MIFYFSGTGNSLWTARELGRLLEINTLSITETTNNEIFSFQKKKQEPVVLVFPVHSWGPAEPMMQFIQKLNGIEQVFAVATCGDECGKTHQILEKELSKKRIELAGCYSVIMPNNYILMPGFDVDPKQIAAEKLHEAPERLRKIADAIRNQQQRKELYHAGSLSFIKSDLIYPVFIRYALGKSAFHCTKSCIGCGICARICPTSNITLQNKRPQWGTSCVQCTACIHRCPVRAIEYGRISLKKGRYCHPVLQNKV